MAMWGVLGEEAMGRGYGEGGKTREKGFVEGENRDRR